MGGIRTITVISTVVIPGVIPVRIIIPVGPVVTGIVVGPIPVIIPGIVPGVADSPPRRVGIPPPIIIGIMRISPTGIHGDLRGRFIIGFDVSIFLSVINIVGPYQFQRQI